MGTRADHTGERFGKLLVVEKLPQLTYQKARYMCVCDCGNKKIVTSSNLVTGHSTSCGCNVKKHNLTRKERLYNIWIGMRQRCNNPNNPDFIQYGGRGIWICKEWGDYLEFRKWALSSGYDDSLSIDRINVNGNYEPGNCRWENYTVQNNNKTDNVIFERHGEKKTLAEWAKVHGIKYSVARQRHFRGWDIERILATPSRRYRF